MPTDQTQRKLSALFCKITMKLEDMHLVASAGMSHQLKARQHLRLARRIQAGAIEILVLAASAEKLVRARPKQGKS